MATDQTLSPIDREPSAGLVTSSLSTSSVTCSRLTCHTTQTDLPMTRAVSCVCLSYKAGFHGTDMDTDIRDVPIVEFCKCVHDSLSCIQSTFTRVHARIPNGHPRAEVGEDVRVGPMEFQLKCTKLKMANTINTELRRDIVCGRLLTCFDPVVKQSEG